MIKKQKTGFTIVELVVVIIIIGILSSITVVLYNGITDSANVSVVQSDLQAALDQLKLYKLSYNSYPTAIVDNCPTAPTVDNDLCLKPSKGVSFSYYSMIPSTFHLTATQNKISYSVTDSTSPSISTTANGSTVGQACPQGFIPVPGSGTYHTKDFCVMKYEAKNVGGVATSQAALVPWNNVNQTMAIAAAATACSGCHLLTEAEWMTVAQNVLSVASNWSDGAVGSGYTYSGHSNAQPNNSLAADTNDSNYNFGETYNDLWQRRTFTLTNGQVIWDLAGNLWEFTSEVSISDRPGIAGEGYDWWREWTALNATGNLIINPFPSGTGLAGAASWDSDYGIGQVYSSSDDTVPHAFVRGGAYNNGITSGVLTLYLDFDSSDIGDVFGFRSAK